MQIWVDADACPGEIKELLFRAAKRTKTKVTLVANQHMRTPRSEFIGSLLVGAGMNAADQRIVELVKPGDLVITADIPLAAEVVANGAQALDPRGELFTDANVGERIHVPGGSPSEGFGLTDVHEVYDASVELPPGSVSMPGLGAATLVVLAASLGSLGIAFRARVRRCGRAQEEGFQTFREERVPMIPAGDRPHRPMGRG